jgi:choline kinase
VILAAGVGDRLKHLGDTPKCLLEFGGRTLLQRNLDVLGRLGIADITICVGYKADLITGLLDELKFDGIRCVHNKAYREGSIVSLWSTRETLRCGDDVILMDADVLCAPTILERLTASPHANCLLLDRDYEAGEEPVKICLRDGLIVEFRKQLDPALAYNLCGESVGFFRFAPEMGSALAAMSEYYVDHDRREAPYEDALRDVLLRHPADFGIEDITGQPWIEIDYPEDVTRAREHVLPSIHDRQH